MNIVYDIKLNNGELIKKCYFIEYQRKVKNGFGNTLAILPDHLKCFIDNEEVLNKNFDNAEVLKIYDLDSQLEITDMIMEKVIAASNMLGYSVTFPIPRGRVILD